MAKRPVAEQITWVANQGFVEAWGVRLEQRTGETEGVGVCQGVSVIAAVACSDARVEKGSPACGGAGGVGAHAHHRVESCAGVVDVRWIERFNRCGVFACDQSASVPPMAR